jgi:phospholipase/carboxylesterase
MPSLNYLPCLEIEPRTTADACVILLHGLGASGHDFEALVPELKLPADMPVRFVFPHAPEMPVTVNGGYVMPAWYDILEMNLERKVDEPQLLASAQAIGALIDREIERGVDSRRIILAGFSQGGAVAYQTALTYSKPLAGLLAMSTYLIQSPALVPHPANRALPILIQHGQFDDVVSEILGQRSRQVLTELGYQPAYQTYPMEHQLCGEQVDDIARWLTARLSA